MCSGQNKYSFTRFGQENKAEANCKHLVSAFRQCPFWVSFSFSPLTHNFFSYVPLLLCRFLLIFYFLFFKSFIAMFCLQREFDAILLFAWPQLHFCHYWICFLGNNACHNFHYGFNISVHLLLSIIIT